jgi:hypothetical protein
MRLVEELQQLAQAAPERHRPLLMAAAENLQAQRLWREAWVQQIRENDKLIQRLTELERLLQLRHHRKEKECED